MSYSKKISLWAIVFLITGVGAWLSLQQNNTNTSSASDFPKIAIADTAAIVAINIATPQQQVQLRKQVATQWNVNDKYPARVQLITLMLFGLLKMEVKRPIANEDKPMVLAQMKETGTKIIINTGNSKNIFYLLPNATDPNSSIYADESMRNLYIVHVPGVKGDLATLMQLGEQDWRSKDIFHSTLYSIHSVGLQYHDAPSDNFSIVFRNNTFELESMPSIDSIKLKKYLSLIPMLGVNQYLDSKADSVKTMMQTAHLYATLTVQDDIELRSEKVDLYFTKDKKTMIAKIASTKELATLSPQMWRFVLVPKKFFIKKQPQGNTPY